MQFSYLGFKQKIFDGKIKLDEFRYYKLPEELKILLENNKTEKRKDYFPGVYDIILYNAIETVENKFKKINLPYREAYVWPSGDYFVYTKSDNNFSDLLRSNLNNFGIIIINISELDEKELNTDPYKFGYSSMKNYIDGINDLKE